MGERFKIIPYITIDGVPTFKDSEIISFYNRMVKDGTADDVFQDGSIRSAENFLDAMKGPNNFLIVGHWQGEPVGVMWANRFQGKFAQNHFCAFSEFWGNRDIILQCGRYGSLYMLDNLGLDMLMGLVPASNKRAIIAVIGSGGKIIGELPSGSFNVRTGESEPTVILSYTREGNEDENIF